MSKFTKFLGDDTGAVTIDWVALTSGILLLGIVVVYSIFNNGVGTLVSKINDAFGHHVDISVSTGTIEGLDP